MDLKGEEPFFGNLFNQICCVKLSLIVKALDYQQPTSYGSVNKVKWETTSRLCLKP